MLFVVNSKIVTLVHWKEIFDRLHMNFTSLLIIFAFIDHANDNTPFVVKDDTADVKLALEEEDKKLYLVL